MFAQRGTQTWVPMPEAEPLLIFVFLVADQIDDDGAGQNYDRVFISVDVHAVGVGPGKPFLAYLRHDLAVTLKGVFVIEEAALRFQIVGAGHIDGETTAKQREELLLYHSDLPAFALNLVGGSPRQQLLADKRQFVALHVLEGKLVAPTEGASINKEDVSALGVADGEIITKRPELLFQ